MIELPDLTTLDADKVRQAQALVADSLSQWMPGVDVTRGAVADVLVAPAGELVAAISQEMERIRSSLSLRLAIDSATTLDPDLIDNILSNYGIERRAAVNAGGRLRLIMSSATPVTLPTGTGFIVAGYRFQTDRAFSARSPSDPTISATDIPLTASTDGTYYWLIDVVSADTISIPVRTGDRADALVPVPGLLSARAEADFFTGVSAETAEELVESVQDGIAPPTAGTARGIISLVRKLVPAASASVVEYGDAEQIRYHTDLPGVGGSRVDVYVRTSDLPAIGQVTKSGVCTSVQFDGSTIWQIGLTRDDLPGFYEIVGIKPSNSPTADLGVEPSTYQFGVDVRGEADIRLARHGTFTRYQTAVITFIGPSGIVGERRDFTVSASLQGQLVEIDEYLLSRENRPEGVDILVHGAVPCRVILDATVKISGQAAQDRTTIVNALAKAVNAVSFSDELSTDEIASRIAGQLPVGHTLVSLSGFGRILGLDREEVIATGPRRIIVPDLPARGISYRTVCFFCDPADIIVNFEAARSA